MPVSDLYVVQYLLQETNRANGGLEWEERSRERAGFTARAGGVSVDLENAHFRAGTRVMLRFQSAGESFAICEPLRQGWLAQSYESDDDRTLAAAMRELMRCVSRQCAERRSSAFDHAAEIRQRVCEQLLFREASVDMLKASAEG
ncbi:MAG: hypothetical protein ABL995_11780 [Bryobacteraceae bacterium]